MKHFMAKLGLLFFIAVSFIHGQKLDLGISYNGYYTDNIFLNSDMIGDLVNSLGLEINYGGQNFNLYLEGIANLYLDNPDFNSLKLEPGFEYLKYLKGRNYLYFNLSYPVLRYRNLFTDFNYQGPAAQLGAKLYLSPTLLFKGGYNFQFRDYPNFSSFDFFNHNLFLEINKFFQSQTTIRFQSGINYRYYPHVEDNSYGSENQNKAGGSSFSVPNVYALLRISKGFGVNVGLSGEYEYRNNFSGFKDAQTLIENAYVIYPYNDDYLWDGSRISLNVKFIPFHEIEISGLISFFDKYYPGIYVMDDQGAVIIPEIERKDTQFMAELSIEKKFPRWKIYLSGMIKINQSNDEYFTYNAVALLAGIDYYWQ